MTRQKTFKHDVRARMQKTGERYTAARHQLLQRAEGGAGADESVLAADAGRETEADVRDPAGAPMADEPPVSEESVLAATGRGWNDWFAVLDEWGAAARRHPEIARWLVAEQGIGSWWAQSVTVAYERARGMRRKHQQAGGFAVGTTRTMAASPEDVARAFSDPALLERWLPDAELRPRPTRAANVARFDWAGGSSRLVVSFSPRGDGKTQVAVQHERLPDAEAAERTKAFWRERLGALKELLEG